MLQLFIYTDSTVSKLCIFMFLQHSSIVDAIQPYIYRSSNAAPRCYFSVHVAIYNLPYFWHRRLRTPQGRRTEFLLPPMHDSSLNSVHKANQRYADHRQCAENSNASTLQVQIAKESGQKSQLTANNAALISEPRSIRYSACKHGVLVSGPV